MSESRNFDTSGFVAAIFKLWLSVSLPVVGIDSLKSLTLCAPLYGDLVTECDRNLLSNRKQHDIVVNSGKVESYRAKYGMIQFVTKLYP